MQNEQHFFRLRAPLWLYIVLWLFFAYLYVVILSYRAEASDNLVLSALYLVEFGVHEISHLVVAFLPPVLVAAAGSAGEVTFTWLIVWAAVKARSFSVVFGLLWVMLAMHNVGRYMADAQVMQLPLVGPGENVKHDWNFVFGQLGWLPACVAIGNTVAVLGAIIGALGLLLGLALIGMKAMDRRANT